jgi:Thermostable hemolysin
MAFAVVSRSSELRGAVEAAIRTRYRRDYQAVLRTWPATLVADIGATGRVECAAGVRFGPQMLFAEHYLDHPIDLALRRETGEAVERERIVEVCHLVAPRAGCALSFVRRLIDFICAADADWAIFTATRPLRRLLARSRMDMVELARAERGRVSEPGDWGSYFDHDPRVMAVSRHAVGEAGRPYPARLVERVAVHA